MIYIIVTVAAVAAFAGGYVLGWVNGYNAAIHDRDSKGTRA